MAELNNATLACDNKVLKLQQKAERELNEKPEWRLRDIEALRNLVLANKALTSRVDDEFLLCFLRAKKFDYDRAYQLLVNYYMHRIESKEVFHNFKPSAILPTLEDRITAILPNRTSEGCRILYFRSGLWSPDKYEVWEILRANLMSLEKVLREEETQICGVVVIHNMSDLGWRHLRNVDKKTFKVMLGILQEAFPLRLKGMHVIHQPAIFSLMFSLIKPFMKEKFASRIHMHGASMSSLRKHFDVSQLPEELGGSLPSGDILAQQWAEELQSSEAMFEDMSKYGFRSGDELFVPQDGPSYVSQCASLGYY